jgi:hypothetical protein
MDTHQLQALLDAAGLDPLLYRDVVAPLDMMRRHEEVIDTETTLLSDMIKRAQDDLAQLPDTFESAD